MPYINGDLSTSLLPTVDQIKKYLRLANTISDSKIKRDVRPLMSFLQRLCEVDSYLMGLVHTRKLAVKSFKYDIRLPLEYKISPAEETQLTETKTRFRRSNMSKIIEDAMDGILYGMSAVRLTYDNTNYGTMVIDKFTYDLTDLDFSDTAETLVEIVTDSKSGKFTINELDPEIHIITRHNPLKNRKNYIGSFMRSVMLLSYLKYHTRWDWRDLNKRHGVPSTYATHPEGISDEDVSKLISMVEKLKNDAVAVFPEYVKILYDEALKNDSTTSFEKFVQACNTELAIALHGQNLTTEVQQGSRAAAEVHNQVDDLIIASDLAEVQQIITNQFLRHDYLLNYGEPKNDFFEFVFVREEQEDFESNSRIVTNLFADPEVRKQLPLKKDEVYKKLGFSKPAEGDEVFN